MQGSWNAVRDYASLAPSGGKPANTTIGAAFQDILDDTRKRALE